MSDVYLGQGLPLMQESLKIKEQVKTEWEDIRQERCAAKQTYETVLARERLGHSASMLQMLKRFYSSVSQGNFDYMEYMGIVSFHHYLHYLQKVSDCDSASWPELKAFMDSDHYTSLPLNDIESRLCSSLTVCPERKIKPGDRNDVEMLSAAIPISDWVVADKDMVNRIELYGIDEHWKTEIFSMRTLDRLIEKLNLIKAVQPARV